MLQHFYVSIHTHTHIYTPKKKNKKNKKNKCFPKGDNVEVFVILLHTGCQKTIYPFGKEKKKNKNP